MFYRMINQKRDIWLSSIDCTISEIINYIISTNQMRDAQIEAIKTYLYLKVACNNRPLWELFSNGEFNTLDIDNLEISNNTRKILSTNPAALALFEYSKLTNDKNEQVLFKLEELIKNKANAIEYITVFKEIFYGVAYTDYLFSLPMGAGKTYLMAAFIYLDLYFAQNEPNNKVFAHNFIIFAPSGLKSSIVPSLKTIQNFNPAWLIPEPAANKLKGLLKFVVLDQQKTANKSNKIKNPNVQKIIINQPLDELMGLVVVTNAEKVILDRIKIENGQINLFEESDDEKDRKANELRNVIGKLPNLAIYIDEVHHVVDENIKLRGVVNSWSKNNTINSVIGFSGTPYLSSAENIKITETFSYKNLELSNVVYYYPLISGINNFLKSPRVYISTKTDSVEIVESGVRNFLDNYKNKIYSNNLTAKLGIYCGKIETLEEKIYPKVKAIVNEYGLNPNDIVLKFHKGNKTYKLPPENEMEFISLDTPVSKVRIVLLVQVGKEGWDCRSLTGVILSQKGDCATNMVLQTSCRCLRQVDKGSYETAVIWLNEFNAKKLNEQLEEQQHISIKEFSEVVQKTQTELFRYSRMKHLKLPPLDFFQLKVQYETIIIEEDLNTNTDIINAVNEESKIISLTKIQTFDGKVTGTTVDKESGKDIANYDLWLYKISKESFGFVTMKMLNEHSEELIVIFKEITYDEKGTKYFSSKFIRQLINGNIIKAFYEKRSFISREEIKPEKANLLRVENLESPFKTFAPDKFFPNQFEVSKIINSDKGISLLDKKTKIAIEALEMSGNIDIANGLRNKNIVPEYIDKTFHYIPYNFTGSSFEQKFLEEIVTLEDFKSSKLEVYYNGDRKLTDFKIKCFKGKHGKWCYIGKYTPDFLIIKRKDNKIHKAIIIETKGSGFANDKDFNDKKDFIKSTFIGQNNEKYGYDRFEYLYLEDSLTDTQRIEQTSSGITNFFKEEN